MFPCLALPVLPSAPSACYLFARLKSRQQRQNIVVQLGGPTRSTRIWHQPQKMPFQSLRTFLLNWHASSLHPPSFAVNSRSVSGAFRFPCQISPTKLPKLPTKLHSTNIFRSSQCSYFFKKEGGMSCLNEEGVVLHYEPHLNALFLLQHCLEANI